MQGYAHQQQGDILLMSVYDRTIQISLAALGQPEGTVTIKNPMWLKQRDLARLQSATNDPNVLTEWLSGLIEGWSLTDYDGVAIPHERGPEGIEFYRWSSFGTYSRRSPRNSMSL